MNKQNCECGKISKVKGYCLTCYQKYYRKKIKEGEIKPDSSLIFNSVLKEVKKGFTISKACEIAKIKRSSFYNVISAHQKYELHAFRIIGFVDEDDF